MSIADIIAAERALQDTIQRTTEGALVDYFRPFFEAHPEVGAVEWGQWAPYFNDGDPCVFGIHGDTHARPKAIGRAYYDERADYDDEDGDGGEDAVIDDQVQGEAEDLVIALPLSFLERLWSGVVAVSRDGTVSKVAGQHD